MPRPKPAALILLACAALLATFGALAPRYSHAAAWRLSADQRPWVERTLDVAAAGSNTRREDIRRTTRPRLGNRPGQLCVILLTHRKNGDGSHQACFDRKTGHLVEQRQYGPSFGPTPLADPLWELVW